MLGPYNITSEYGALLTAIFLIFMMLESSPRVTSVFRINIFGVVTTIITQFLYRVLLGMCVSLQYYVKSLFNLLCILFFMSFTIVISTIYSYIDQLSYSHRGNIKPLNHKIWIFFSISLITYCVLLLSGKMYTVTESIIELTSWFYIFLVFGLFGMLAVIANLIANRKTIPKRVLQFMFGFIPLELLMLLFQFHHKTIVIISIICLAPFIVLYIMFHSNPINEWTGCQNEISLENRFLKCKIKGKSFLVLDVVLPRLKNTKHLFKDDKVLRVVAQRCQQVAAVHKNSYVYTLSDSECILFIVIKPDEDVTYIIKDIVEICNQNTNISDLFFTPVYKLIAFKDNKVLSSFEKFSGFRQYLFNQMEPNAVNDLYVAQDRDYDIFTRQYNISQMLLQIKATGNLDDEHVLCYAQPILDVQNNSFRSAEALMRLVINDETIYPDMFVPAAEQSNCIHMLTCIMINKVCKKIHELSEYYDFDAITVNCSTTEFSNPNLYKELLNIINSNNIDPSKICLELTESAMSEDYEMVIHNIKMLKENGIHFYLDDFGTGYSNLERIFTCPFKTIKFDKSLLYKSMDDKTVNELMISMVEIFKRRGFKLLVEGVEDNDQNKYSVDVGFDFIQGYKYSKPVPIDELSNFFSKK